MAGIKGGKADVFERYSQASNRPKFVFPTTHQPETDLNNILHTVIETNLTDTVNNTLTNNTVNLAEMTTSNSSFINVVESTTSNIITSIFGRNETNMMENNATMLNTTSFNETDTMNNSTTTENIINFLTNTTSDIATSIIPTKKYGFDDKDFNQTNPHHDQMSGEYHKTTFIIMGTLIGLLLIIGLILVAVYVSYKKKNSVPLRGHYTSKGSREIASSNDVEQSAHNNDQYNTKC